MNHFKAAKRNTVLLMHFAICIIVIVFSNNSCRRENKDIYQFVPKNAILMISTNIQEFRKLFNFESTSIQSELKIYLKELYVNKKDGRDKFSKFLEMENFDFLDELESYLFFICEKIKGKPPIKGIVIETSPNCDKFIRALELLVDFTGEKSHLGIPIRYFTENNISGALIIPDSKYVVISSKDVIKDILEVYRAKKENVFSNQKLRQLIDSEPDSYLIRLSKLYEDISKYETTRKDLLGIQIPQIEMFFINIGIRKTEAKLFTLDKSEKQRFTTMLNAFKSIISSMEIKTNDEEMIASLYKSASFRDEGDFIRIELETSELIFIIMDKINRSFVFTTQKEKQKATMINMEAISSAIGNYIIDNYEAPQYSSLEEILEKIPNFQPFYITQMPLKDEWGNNFLYICEKKNQKYIFSIASPGRDGIFGGWSQKGKYLIQKIEDYNHDIILSDGKFVFYPALKSKAYSIWLALVDFLLK